MEARELVRHSNIDDNFKARQILEQALEIDPSYAVTYRWLAGTYFMEVWLGSAKSPEGSLKRAFELSNKAISIDDTLGDAQGLLGNIYVLTRQYEKGIQELKKAINLNPNYADAYAFLAMGHLFMGNSKEGILRSRQAIRLNPMAPSWYFHNLAAIYRNLKNYNEAEIWAEKAVQQEPKNNISRLVLCSIYSLLKKDEEARIEANEIMKLNPQFSLKKFKKTLPLKDLEAKNRFINALSKAGLE